MPNRRDFLKTALGASAGVAFVGCSICNAKAARMPAQAAGAVKRKEAMVGKRRVKTVDVHCHVDIPEIQQLLKGTKLDGRAIGNGGYDDYVDPARFQAMDAMGIDVQAMSINSFWYGENKEFASRIVDFQNEKLSAICAAHPDRLVAFASVALQFPELAAQQLEVGMKKWGLRGAAISTNCEGEDLSAPKYEPFWAKAEELDALVFVHPGGGGSSAAALGKRLQGNGLLGNVIGNPLDTSIFLSHMIFDGTLDKFPNLKICAAHAGGYLASYPDRMDNGCRVFPPQCKGTIKKHPSEYIRQIYVDTIIFTQEGLRHLVADVGASHIGLGTDYPYPWATTPVDHVMAATELSDADKIAIIGGTMCKLLKIPT
jgi:aminocarboxymuconate-semialdehyde decarboxylase